MKITDKYIGLAGVEYIFEYEDMDSFDSLPLEECRQCYGVCFYGDQMAIVYNSNQQHWGLVGGTIEPGETREETLIREIKEESNMEVLSFQPIGAQKAIDTRDGSFVYQLRYMCIVKPYGEFVSDPGGHVSEVKLIDPKDYKKYFDWKEIGERIISRALELKSQLVI